MIFIRTNSIFALIYPFSILVVTLLTVSYVYKNVISVKHQKAATAPVITTSIHHICRSLFTINNLTDNHTLQNSANHKQKRPHFITMSKQYLVHYSASSPPSTQQYHSLASLLPSLFSLQKNNSAPHAYIPILSRISRIDTKAGVLPYVSCSIMPYDNPSSVTTCFTRRLAAHHSLWIEFMGDSKIREVYYEFLQRTDLVLNYTVKLPVGKNSSLRKM